MAKLLYIIKGEHTDEMLTDEVNAGALACHEVQIGLLSEIARQTGCTTYFEDGMSEDSAQFGNDLLEKIAASSDGEKERIFRILEDWAESQGAYSDDIDTIRGFADLWGQGIPIRYYKTEDEFDVLGMLKGRVPDEDYALACSYVMKGGDPCGLMTSKKLWPVLMIYRDKNIYENVHAQARGINILFVGRFHSLEDFRKGGHEFKIYEVEVAFNNDGIVIKGVLPACFKSYIDDLTSKHQLTNKVTYES